ncbi:MAG: hypothetical protein R3300_01315 [Candidatus Promineifilaceae bacterium]|nr:hypothetical protein [Candidatus Promineifilaceae bacterium]
MKEQVAQELMGKPNVVGVGVGYKIVGGQTTDQPAILVFVQRKVAAENLTAEEMVPAEVEGVTTDVIESGPIYAQQARTDKFRPAPGGVSIGHFQVTAGTLGVMVRDKSSGERLILSNNHVLANSNDAAVGDAIIQPGSADGGRVAADLIATLLRYEPLRFQGAAPAPPSCGVAVNYAAIGNFIAQALGAEHRIYAYRPQAEQAANVVDAAIARPQNSEIVLDDILEIGKVAGTVEAMPGMAVRKSGRTTALTSSTITAIDATVTVNYGGGRNALFEGQIISGPMSQPGDSGSLVVEANSKRAVGLLFAGSNQTTIFSPAAMVAEVMNISFD